MKGITIYLNCDDAKYYSEWLKKTSQLFGKLGEHQYNNPSLQPEERVKNGVEFMIADNWFKGLAEKIDKKLETVND